MRLCNPPVRYPLIFATLAAIVLVEVRRLVTEAQPYGWALAAVEASFAVSLLALAVLYGLKGLGLPVEESCDRPGWVWVRFLLVPYWLIAGMTLRLARRLERGGSWNEVVPGLWIGRYPFRDERSQLVNLGITGVLNLCLEFPPRTGPTNSEFLRIPILDATPPSTQQFLRAIEWIDRRRAEGKGVLIHCAQGHGRSATITAAMLVRAGLAKTGDEALRIVRSARPGARPSRSQREALIAFLST